MAALKPVPAALLLMLSASAGAHCGRVDDVPLWHREITTASARTGIPAIWIGRVMRAESCGRTRLNGRPIVSGAGAMGLMQLMPATWLEMRADLALGPDPHAPRDNILAGAAYLRRMYDRFGYPGLFAAYNAGPARYASHLMTGRPLPGETRTYLLRVAGTASETQWPVSAEARPGLFAVGSAASKDHKESAANSGLKPLSDPLFSVRVRR